MMDEETLREMDDLIEKFKYMLETRIMPNEESGEGYVISQSDYDDIMAGIDEIHGYFDDNFWL